MRGPGLARAIRINTKTPALSGSSPEIESESLFLRARRRKPCCALRWLPKIMRAQGSLGSEDATPVCLNPQLNSRHLCGAG